GAFLWSAWADVAAVRGGVAARALCAVCAEAVAVTVPVLGLSLSLPCSPARLLLAASIAVVLSCTALAGAKGAGAGPLHRASSAHSSATQIQSISAGRS